MGVNASYVKFDNEGGSFKVVEHLIALGHRRIGIICRDIDVEESAGRLKGYELALQTFGLPLDNKLILSGNAVEMVGYELMGALTELNDPPTAVFTATNIQAAGVIRYCNEHRIRIPEDMAVASFESFGDLNPVINPPLTANDMPTFELGAIAAKSLFSIINNTDHHMVQETSLAGTFVVRASTVNQLKGGD